MDYLLGALLFGIAFVGLSYLFHGIGYDVHKSRREKEQKIGRR